VSQTEAFKNPRRPPPLKEGISTDGARIPGRRWASIRPVAKAQGAKAVEETKTEYAPDNLYMYGNILRMYLTCHRA
jgi:hypothetical protein